MISTESTFDPVAYINHPRWRDSHYGLERIQKLLENLGNPHEGMRFIHVAGTNGKGSVCAYLAQICEECGLVTGLFTSPYIHVFEERIRCNGANISADDLLEITLAVKDAADKVERDLGEHPTEFELMTAVAFSFFAKKQCDIAIVEVGLGGRLDSTNAITPLMSVITKIGLDHTELLGDTLGVIAAEKAGIIKQGIPCITCPQDPAAAEVIAQRAASCGSKLIVADLDELSVGGIDPVTLTRSFSYESAAYTTKLLGSYQPFNATLAIEAARMIPPDLCQVDEERTRAGIAATQWPGRFEVVSTRPLVIVDGAHNPQGASALAESIDDLIDTLGYDPDTFKVTFIMGVLADKDYRDMLEPLIGYARDFYVYTPLNPRALSADDLALCLPEDMKRTICAHPREAMRAAIQEKTPEDVIIAFGSLYAIDDLMSGLPESPDQSQTR